MAAFKGDHISAPGITARNIPCGHQQLMGHGFIELASGETVPYAASHRPRRGVSLQSPILRPFELTTLRQTGMTESNEEAIMNSFLEQ